jgi:hypothetical protein
MVFNALLLIKSNSKFFLAYMILRTNFEKPFSNPLQRPNSGDFDTGLKFLDPQNKYPSQDTNPLNEQLSDFILYGLFYSLVLLFKFYLCIH